MKSMTRWSSLAVALLLSAAPAAAQPKRRVVVIPFENVSRDVAARDVVMVAVETALAKKGYEVVTGAPVEDFLKSRRIRYLDSLAARDARDLVSEQRADAVVLGTILKYSGREWDAEVALSVKAISPDATVLWSEVTGVVAAKSEGAFGIGKLTRIQDVARRAATEAIASMPHGRELGRVRVWRATDADVLPRVFRSAEVVGRDVKICVLPLQNLTPERAAPRVVEGVLQHRLSQLYGVTVVQPADMRQAFRTHGLRAPSQMSIEAMRTLARGVGTPLLLQGSILSYGTSAASRSGNTPEVELYLTLIDVERGRVVWSGLHKRRGHDYEKALQMGAVPDHASLVSRTVAELIAAFTRR